MRSEKKRVRRTWSVPVAVACCAWAVASLAGCTPPHRHPPATETFGEVYSIAFSPDGKTLATAEGACEDATQANARLYDVATATELRTLDGHLVRSVAFFPDGKTLVTGGWDIHVWDVASGKELPSHFSPDRKVDEECVAVSPDGDILCSGSRYATVDLWEASTHEKIATLKGHVGPVAMVTFSPDGRTLASAGEDRTIRLWDTKAHKEIHKFTGHTREVESVAFSPDGQMVASGSRDFTVRIWNVARGNQRHVLRGHKHFVEGVAWSPDGKILASASADTTVCLWNPSTGKQIRKLEPNASCLTVVAFSPDGKTLAMAGNMKVVFWNLESNEKVTIDRNPISLVKRSPASTTSPVYKEGSGQQQKKNNE